MQNKFPAVMKAIALCSGGAMLLSVLLFAIRPAAWLTTVTISLGTTCYHVTMRLLVGTLIPSHIPNHAWFRPKPWEAALYRKLRVKRWKHKLPTYAPAQFSLQLYSPEQVLAHMRGAEVVHEVIIVLSFLPLAASLFWGAFPVFLITSLLSALFDSLFVMAQRYNRPRLERILQKTEAKNL